MSRPHMFPFVVVFVLLGPPSAPTARHCQALAVRPLVVAALSRPSAVRALHAPLLSLGRPLRTTAPCLLSAPPSFGRAAEREGVSFLGGFTRVQDMPFTRLPEITLVGRSNVGKSSALNTLAGRRKKIAVVSKTPGRTRMIDLFQVGSACTVTDLPGYGFAKVSKELQDEWRKQIEGYLRNREALRLAVLFVDAQREPQPADAQLLDFLEYEGMSTLVVATKSDKLGKRQLQESLERLRESLALPDDQPLPLSSKTGDGKQAVWAAITTMSEAAPARQRWPL